MVGADTVPNPPEPDPDPDPDSTEPELASEPIPEPVFESPLVSVLALAPVVDPGFGLDSKSSKENVRMSDFA